MTSFLAARRTRSRWRAAPWSKRCSPASSSRSCEADENDGMRRCARHGRVTDSSAPALDVLGLERIEVGVIYSDLRRLTRLNSHPIDADGYLIGLARAFGLSQKRDWRMRAAGLARSRPPRSTPLTRKMLSRAFQD